MGNKFVPIYTGGMPFGEALENLKFNPDCRKVARVGWNGKGMSIELQVPDENSKMTLPYLFMNTTDGERVPWLISQSDALASDWVFAPN